MPHPARRADGTTSSSPAPQRLTPEQQALAAQWLPLIDTVLTRYRVPYPLYHECRADAQYVLCRAALRFDPARGVSFYSFAFTAILREVRRTIRREHKHEHAPLPDEHAPLPDESCGSEQALCDPHGALEDAALADERLWGSPRHDLRQAMARALSAPARSLLYRYYFRGVPLRRLAQGLGVATEVVRERLRAAREELQVVLEAEGA